MEHRRAGRKALLASNQNDRDLAAPPFPDRPLDAGYAPSNGLTMKVRTLLGGTAATAALLAALSLLVLPEPCAACSPARDFEELTLELTSVMVDGVETSTAAYDGFAVGVPGHPDFPGMPVLEAVRGGDVVRLNLR